MKGLALALALAAPLPAAAQDFCEVLAQMMGGTFEPEIHPDLSESIQCGTSRDVSGQTAQHCRWPFAFRAIMAKTLYDEISEQVALCPGYVLQDPEAGVNHPDTFDQRLFQNDKGTVSVSLKDKGALQQTLVFLRVEHKAP